MRSTRTAVVLCITKPVEDSGKIKNSKANFILQLENNSDSNFQQNLLAKLIECRKMTCKEPEVM